MYKEPFKKLVLDLGSIKQNGAADFKLVGKMIMSIYYLPRFDLLSCCLYPILHRICNQTVPILIAALLINSVWI